MLRSGQRNFSRTLHLSFLDYVHDFDAAQNDVRAIKVIEPHDRWELAVTFTGTSNCLQVNHCNPDAAGISFLQVRNRTEIRRILVGTGIQRFACNLHLNYRRLRYFCRCVARI